MCWVLRLSDDELITTNANALIISVIINKHLTLILLDKVWTGCWISSPSENINRNFSFDLTKKLISKLLGKPEIALVRCLLLKIYLSLWILTNKATDRIRGTICVAWLNMTNTFAGLKCVKINKIFYLLHIGKFEFKKCIF